MQIPYLIAHSLKESIQYPFRSHKRPKSSVCKSTISQILNPACTLNQLIRSESCDNSTNLFHPNYTPKYHNHIWQERTIHRRVKVCSSQLTKGMEGPVKQGGMIGKETNEGRAPRSVFKIYGPGQTQWAQTRFHDWLNRPSYVTAGYNLT